MANVADRIVEVLEAANVQRIYGLVGDSLNGITESMRVRGKIEWIAVRHEEVAAFAAGAQAQLTGELAVCAGSCGPGNLHLINGLFDCHRNRVPVVAIAAQIPSTEIGSSYFQETHPQSLFKDCSHYVELISDPLQVPRIVETAIREAVAKQGVAVIVIPGDVALKEAGPRVPRVSRCRDCRACVQLRRTSGSWPTFWTAVKERRSSAARVAPVPTMRSLPWQRNSRLPSCTHFAARNTSNGTTPTMWG